jgi:hypothetical protein
MNTLILMAFGFLLPGCAAMALSGGQQVKFDSDPPGAAVQFRGQTCVTPCALTVPRGGKPEMVDFSMDGRESYFGEITSAAAEAIPTSPGVSKGLITAAVVVDILIPGVLLIEQAGGAFQNWPMEISATLPEKGKGTALMRTVR